MLVQPPADDNQKEEPGAQKKKSVQYVTFKTADPKRCAVRWKLVEDTLRDIRGVGELETREEQQQP
eukprot:1188880-Prymnesium_polylepis.1